MQSRDTFYEVMRRHGITRRSFLKFCSLTAAGLGLGPEFAGKIAHALETKPRTPVIWLHGLECTCCTESFIRSGHPLAGDVVLSMISLDYDDTLMAAAGHQAMDMGMIVELLGPAMEDRKHARRVADPPTDRVRVQQHGRGSPGRQLQPRGELSGARWFRLRQQRGRRQRDATCG